MSRSILALPPEQLTPFALDALIAHAQTLNAQNRQTFTTAFPKAPGRWLSHYEFTPHPITLTSQGDVDGGRSWLVGATLDLSFTRSLCATSYGARGGPCYDPASLVFLEVAAKVDQYTDYAPFCRDLHDCDKGRRYRLLAGLHGAVAGEDDLCHFRSRIGEAVIAQITDVAADFLYRFGLIKGELLSTDGQLEPSYARYKGCTYACKDCRALPIDAAGQQALREQVQSGAQRLQLICPFPDVVDKVRAATAKTGPPRAPKMALLECEVASDTAVSDRQPVAELLELPLDQVPPVRLRWCRLQRTPQGELLASCPKVPSDLEAKVGYHVDTKDPSKTERVFGYCQIQTTDLNRDLGLDLPLGNTTEAANVHEGNAFISHRQALAIPVTPGQTHLGDSANDVSDNYRWLHNQGGIAIFDYNRRNEHLDPESLRTRGYDQNGTPSAPCGRLCRSNGYDYQAQSRQYICGLACPPSERRHCPYRFGVLGYSHRMSFQDHPRLIGPIQRGPPAWQRIYAARSASERTNSYNQEVIARAHPLRMRGLKAFRFAGAIRTLAQLLRRALTFVLDVTYTLGKISVART